VLSQVLGTLRADDDRCAVRFERLYDAQPEDLWRALTDEEQLRGWLAQRVSMDARPGGAFELRFGDGDDEWAAGTVEAADPPKLLELRWEVPGVSDPSLVRFEIESRPPGSLLVLDHRRLALNSGAGYSAGWHAYLDALDALLSGTEAADWYARFREVRPGYDEQAVALGWRAPGPSPVREALYRGDRAAAEEAAREADLDVFDAAALGDVRRLGELLDAEPHLVDALADDGFTPLHLACFSGGEAATRLLVERGAPLERVAESSFARVGPLGTAAFSRDLASARVLLEAGAEANGLAADGFTPLHAAAQNGDEALVDLLLGHDADPGVTAPDGRTAAVIARDAGHERCAERLAAVRA
jgi:uncharacterized protein YndB with AHSA1/START domain